MSDELAEFNEARRRVLAAEKARDGVVTCEHRRVYPHLMAGTGNKVLICRGGLSPAEFDADPVVPFLVLQARSVNDGTPFNWVLGKDGEPEPVTLLRKSGQWQQPSPMDLLTEVLGKEARLEVSHPKGGGTVLLVGNPTRHKEVMDGFAEAMAPLITEEMLRRERWGEEIRRAAYAYLKGREQTFEGPLDRLPKPKTPKAP